MLKVSMSQENPAKPQPQLTRQATVSTPVPSPAPKGEVPRAKDWSKKAETSKTVRKAPSPSRDMSRTR